MSLDLNDLRYFALIVEHGGFSAAERHTRITKSKLSRRVALLEERLGVRLLQRSTRKLALTEAGRVFYEHCAGMVVEADAAQRAVEQLRSEPSGRVRMTCPIAMTQFFLAQLVADFMRLHPKVTIELDATDRVVNLIDEHMDVALRTFDAGLRDPSLVSRRITSAHKVLVASAGYASTLPPIDDPQSLAQHDTIGSIHDGPEQVWPLIAADGRSTQVAHRPRLLCSDFVVQHLSTLGGVGIALLPVRVACRGLEEGTLVRVAPDWRTEERDIHLVYASRRGMLPSVRALVDYLAEQVPTAMAG